MPQIRGKAQGSVLRYATSAWSAKVGCVGAAQRRPIPLFARTAELLKHPVVEGNAVLGILVAQGFNGTVSSHFLQGCRHLVSQGVVAQLETNGIVFS